MKIKIERLREIVKQKVNEAAAQGAFQKRAKKSFTNMIRTTGSGGNKNTAPYTKKAKSKNLKSAPPGTWYESQEVEKLP